MTIVKRIVCLANSKKMSGRCVAGRELTEAGVGEWIRPVSSRHDEEVSENERQYEDGGDPKLLDIVDVPLLHQRPHACQTENWLLDPTRYWKRIRSADWNELQDHIERPPLLWINGHSTYHGTNDEIPQAEADTLPCSLHFIRVPSVELRIFAPSEAFGNPKRRVQAWFQHCEIRYGLWVTDPNTDREFLARSNGNYPLGECCLTISLSEPYQKQNSHWFRYKLVAAIIQPDVTA